MSYSLVLSLLLYSAGSNTSAPSYLAFGATCASSASASQTTVRNQRATSLDTQASEALARGDEAAAKSLFQKALELYPRDAVAHTYLGVLADHEGKLEVAAEHFAAAARIDPFSPAARNNLGAILLKLGHPDRAAAQFEASLKLDSNQPNALVNLAQIEFSRDDPKSLRSAERLFERAYKLAPDLEIARALLIVALRMGDKKEASSAYRVYASQVAASGTAPETVDQGLHLGAALLEAGLPGEALEELRAADKIDAGNVEIILLMGKAHEQLRNFVVAATMLESALANGRESAAIEAELAQLYREMGQFEKAIPAMRKAIELDPKNESYYFRYGMLLTDAKAPAAAVIRLNEALKDFPNSAKIWFALGIAQFSYAKYPEAASAFEHTLDLDKKAVPALDYLGMIYSEEGKFAKAIDSFQRAVALSETVAPAHYLLGNALLKQIPPDDLHAEKHLRRALELDPTLDLARMSLAKIYFRVGRLEEASTLLERVVADDPNSAEGLYQLGRTYMRLKRENEARAVLAKFKKLSDTRREQADNERREIVRRLQDVRF